MGDGRWRGRRRENIARAEFTSAGGFHSGLGHADNPNGNTATGVAHGLAVIIGLFVDDETAADDRVSTVEAQMGINQIDHGVAVFVGLDVAQVADVPLGGLPLTVLLGRGVEMAPCCLAIWRPDAEFVDMEPMLTGRQSGDLSFNVDAALVFSERHAPLGLTPPGRQKDRDGLVDLGGDGMALLFLLAGDCGTARPESVMQTREPTASAVAPFLIDMSFLPEVDGILVVLAAHLRSLLPS